MQERFFVLMSWSPPPPLNHSSQACYSRSLLLSYRHSSNLQSPNPLITTPIQCTALSANPSTRTGRRVKFFSRAGEAIFHKKAKHNKFHGIKEFNNSTHRRSPPPRGAPGTPPRGYEECPQHDKVAKEVPRGTIKRRLRRRAYRRWCSHLNKQAVKGLGPPPCHLGAPKSRS